MIPAGDFHPDLIPTAPWVIRSLQASAWDYEICVLSPGHPLLSNSPLFLSFPPGEGLETFFSLSTSALHLFLTHETASDPASSSGVDTPEIREEEEEDRVFIPGPILMGLVTPNSSYNLMIW